MVRSKLVELRSGVDGNREVTVYVKGFLARGEKADHFERWLACHEALEDRTSAVIRSRSSGLRLMVSPFRASRGSLESPGSLGGSIG